MAEPKADTKPKSSSTPSSKVFDIAKPGKSAPTATSVPVIVTNRPILQDPMVVQNASSTPLTDNVPADAPKASLKKELKITPLKIKLSDGSEDAKADVPEPTDLADALQDDDAGPLSDATDDEEHDLGEVAVTNTVSGPPALPENPRPQLSKYAKPGPMIADVMRKASSKKATTSDPTTVLMNEVMAAGPSLADETPKDEATPDDTPAAEQPNETADEPVSEPETSAEPEAEAKAETESEPEPETPATEEAEPPVEEPVADGGMPESTDSIGPEGAKNDLANEQAELNPNEDPAKKAAEAAALEHQAEEQKLIDSQQYFLPINAVERRKTKRHLLVALLVIVVLAIVWGDVALDAGVLQIDGVKAPTNFFKN